MKRYKPLIGAVSLAATLGLYAPVNHDPLSQEPQQFMGEQEHGSEYEAGLLEEEIKEASVSRDSAKIRKEEKIAQIQPNSPKHDQKQKNPQDRSHRTLLPQPQGLDDVVEEEAEERPPYDLSPEEREQLTYSQLIRYGIEALSNQDYKVAETYSSDLKKHHEGKQHIFHECFIGLRYDDDLSDMIEHCTKYDYDSVFRKVMWMNVFFIPKYENSLDCETTIFVDSSSYIVKRINPGLLIQKGNQALEAIEYCHE